MGISALFGGYPTEVWFIAFVACVAGGLARGFAGFGAGMIMSPVFVSLFMPVIGVPLMHLIDALLQLWVVPANFRRIAWREAWFYALIATLAMPVGVLLLTLADPRSLTIGIALVAIAAGLLIASGWRYRGRQTRALSAAVAASAGTMGGASSMSGPPVILFSMASGDDPERTRARINGFFALSSAAAVAVFTVQGLMTWEVVKLTLLLLPAYVGATIVGHYIFPLASARTFRMIAVAMIVTAGALAIVRAL